MCVQPAEQEWFSATQAELADKGRKQKERAEHDLSEHKETEHVVNGLVEPADQLTKLYQADFAEGTNRITAPGNYIVMEDRLRGAGGLQAGRAGDVQRRRRLVAERGAGGSVPGRGRPQERLLSGFLGGNHHQVPT